jgi:DNA-binding response OmpR family regulator
MVQTHPSGDISSIPIILLVEDDPDTRDMYSLFLESKGMWVATAADPAAAATAVAELRPDLIVTDVGFNGRALGLEFAHAVRHAEATAHVPIVLLTGHAPDQMPATARTDADLLLVKPVLPDDLALHIGALLQRSRAVRARNEAAVARAAVLVEKSKGLLAKSQEIDERMKAKTRPCPVCERKLDWVETGTIRGVDYDYYHWCEYGCGLYCFERGGQRWIKLAD